MKLRSQLLALFVGAVALVSVSTAATETYTIDPVHSTVGFSIRHVFSKVTGTFNSFQGSITVDRDNLAASTVSATIDIASVDTHSEKRDGHLKTPDFFDAAKFPTMTFKSKTWTKTSDTTFDVTGDLTIKDVTKQVVLKVTSLGFGPGMMGAPVSGWEASTTINRTDFGVNGPTMLGKAVGEDVTISISVEADLKK